jgi:FeS assembly SUF system regulator
MLRMSRLTDYGLVLLTHLASAPVDQVHNARELAESAHLPLPMVSKILKVLTREGFLVSQRGAKGGYSLARRPQDVTVVAVIDALEGPIALTECGAGSCEREANCVVRAPWQRINRVVRQSLEDVRLADLITPPPFPSQSSLESQNAQ